MSPWFNLDPCPDSVWELLPGGREARNEVGGEVWRYVRTFVKPGRSDRFTHEFQHDSHPLYDGHVVVTIQRLIFSTASGEQRMQPSTNLPTGRSSWMVMVSVPRRTTVAGSPWT